MRPYSGMAGPQVDPTDAISIEFNRIHTSRLRVQSNTQYLRPNKNIKNKGMIEQRTDEEINITQ